MVVGILIVQRKVYQFLIYFCFTIMHRTKYIFCKKTEKNSHITVKTIKILKITHFSSI